MTKTFSEEDISASLKTIWLSITFIIPHPKEHLAYAHQNEQKVTNAKHTKRSYQQALCLELCITYALLPPAGTTDFLQKQFGTEVNFDIPVHNNNSQFFFLFELHCQFFLFASVLFYSKYTITHIFLKK